MRRAALCCVLRFVVPHCRGAVPCCGVRCDVATWCDRCSSCDWTRLSGWCPCPFVYLAAFVAVFRPRVSWWQRWRAWEAPTPPPLIGCVARALCAPPGIQMRFTTFFAFCRRAYTNGDGSKPEEGSAAYTDISGAHAMLLCLCNYCNTCITN